MLQLLTIGSGSIVGLFLDGVRRTEGIELAAVYSRSRDRAEVFGRKHGAKVWSDDLDALLAREDVNCVYVAAPNSLHYGYVRRALEAGKNVICEKPFVDTAAQCRELGELARAKGVYLFEAISVLHMPVYNQVKAWLKKIGPVRLADIRYCQYSSRYDMFLRGEITNVFNPLFGGGAMRDINVYNLHVMADLFGLPREGIYIANRGNNGVDCSGTAVFTYDGMVCTCTGAKDCDGENHALFEGEKGYITVTSAGNAWSRAELHLRGHEAQEISTDLPNRLQPEIEAFVRIIGAGDRAQADALLEESGKVMQILDMIEA